MKKLEILINGKRYEINLETGTIVTYTFLKGDEAAGDIEGYEAVGKVVRFE